MEIFLPLAMVEEVRKSIEPSIPSDNCPLQVPATLENDALKMCLSLQKEFLPAIVTVPKNDQLNRGSRPRRFFQPRGLTCLVLRTMQYLL
ncbi:unnamed protein product [Fusarium venenatum]|uniref:Uncharacterized protein n=1 Tax=Fusarium venenatum TaxID=56646 RepID=A0A2L2TMY5_9HYPO|nr:uncharacterized protein FVRRES_02559 [Fusarium venenatum]CEI66047.1 unnamed protein product [Fusarium venenatum]